MSTYTNDQVAHLVEGSLDWETTFRMLSMPKDHGRFEQYLAAHQQWSGGAVIGGHAAYLRQVSADAVTR